MLFIILGVFEDDVLTEQDLSHKYAAGDKSQRGGLDTIVKKDKSHGDHEHKVDSVHKAMASHGQRSKYGPRHKPRKTNTKDVF